MFRFYDLLDTTMASKQSNVKPFDPRMFHLEPSSNQVGASLLEMQVYVDARMENSTEQLKTRRVLNLDEMPSEFQESLERSTESSGER